MGVDSNLYINARYGTEDVAKLIEKHIPLKEGSKVEIINTHTPDYHVIAFEPLDSHARQLSCFTGSDTPLGPSTHLMYRSNDEGIAIFRALANVVGGYLEESDSTGTLECITGRLSENNGLPYFIRYALINNEMKDEDDVQGLLDSIKKWEKECRDSRFDMTKRIKELKTKKEA